MVWWHVVTMQMEHEVLSIVTSSYNSHLVVNAGWQLIFPPVWMDLYVSFMWGGFINNKHSSNADLYANTGWLLWWMRQSLTLAAFVDMKCNFEIKTQPWPRITQHTKNKSELMRCSSHALCLCVLDWKDLGSLEFLYFLSQFLPVYSVNKAILSWQNEASFSHCQIKHLQLLTLFHNTAGSSQVSGTGGVNMLHDQLTSRY